MPIFDQPHGGNHKSSRSESWLPELLSESKNAGTPCALVNFQLFSFISRPQPHSVLYPYSYRSAATIMSSFTTLAPEIRSLVYNELLQSSLSSEKRIVYECHCLKRCTPPCSHDRMFSVLSKRGQVKVPKTMERLVHLADIGDLLNLAATCHRLRSEILGLAWSNADIHIRSTNDKSETLIGYATNIFTNRLSPGCCNLIRTLHIDVPERTWKPDQMRALSTLVRDRLPEFKTLKVSIRRLGAYEHLRHPQQALSALANFPFHVAIIVRNNFSCNPFVILAMFLSPDGSVAAAVKRRDRSDQAHLDAVRSRGQKRRKLKLKREKKDLLVDILDATAAMRSLALG
ncbi:hypothetical protein KCU95_g12163, partial [Aureobasidium melanogenum]